MTVGEYEFAGVFIKVNLTIVDSLKAHGAYLLI